MKRQSSIVPAGILTTPSCRNASEVVKESGSGCFTSKATESQVRVLCGSEYVVEDDIMRDRGVTEKDQLGMLKLSRYMGRGARRPINVTLAYRATLTTAVNTAYTTVIGVAPSLSSTEWGQLAALYDEVKVLWLHLDFYVGTIGATPGLLTLGVFAFDAANSGAITSVSSGMQSAQHKVFSTHLLGSNTGGQVAYPAQGRIRWKVVIPPGSCRSVSLSSNMGKEWSSTADSSDTYGFIKPYVEAGGAGSQYQIAFTMSMHCKFRCRT